MNESIQAVILAIKPHKEFVKKAIETGGRVDLYVSMLLETCVGEVFSSQTLRELADLSVSLGIDVKCARTAGVNPQVA